MWRVSNVDTNNGENHMKETNTTSNNFSNSLFKCKQTE